MEERFLNSGRNCTALLCTAFIGVIVLGTNKLAAQLFLTFMDFFKVGRKDASFPFTLVQILRSTSGPLTGYLGRKYGVLAVTEFGCLLCVVGVGGCFFAKSITTISILWGVVYGLGTGLGSLLIPHILRDFFDKNYDKAHGYYISGAGIGGFLLPLMADALLNQYGLAGTFLIFSALMLNFIVATLILRFLKRGPHMYDDPKVVPKDFKSSKELKRVEIYNVSSSNLKLTILELSNIESNGNSRRNAKMDPVQPYIPELIAKTELHDVAKLNIEQSKEFSAPGTELKNNNSMAGKKGHENLESTELRTKETSENIFLEVLQIFIDPSFVIILITQCIYIFVYNTVYTTVIDFARDIGVPPDLEVYILINIGMTDVVGRIALGYVTDGGCMSQLNFYVLSFILLGIMFSIVTVIKSTLVLMIALSVVGLILGGLAMISVGLMFGFIEKEKMIIATPCRFFLYPFLGFAKPFLIEYFREGHGSYNGLMFLLTGMCFFNALLSMLLPAAKRFNEKRKEK